jgi:hypothetical protein
MLWDLLTRPLVSYFSLKTADRFIVLAFIGLIVVLPAINQAPSIAAPLAILSAVGFVAAVANKMRVEW